MWKDTEMGGAGESVGDSTAGGCGHCSRHATAGPVYSLISSLLGSVTWHLACCLALFPIPAEHVKLVSFI